jgi:hypothetical protein
MPKTNNNQIENLIETGVIGAALGALVSKKNKGAGVVLGGIAGAAITASLEAYENAKETNISFLVEEDDVLYEVRSNGSKKKIKNLPHSNTVLPKKFTLK